MLFRQKFVNRTCHSISEESLEISSSFKSFFILFFEVKAVMKQQEVSDTSKFKFIRPGEV